MKWPKHSTWKSKQQKQGREKDKEAAPQRGPLYLQLKQKNATVVFQSQNTDLS